MCLIVFGYKSHPKYDLVFAANRDEFHQRPTRAARFWDRYPHVLAGKDLQAGGTWMGVAKNGSFAALTNYRDPEIQKENPPSRGHLVLDYLKESTSPEYYLHKVDKEADAYNGFSLLVGTVQNLMYYSNRQQTQIEVKPGIHGLSNHLLDTPWPKVERAKEKLADIMNATDLSEEALFELLADEQKPPENRLPDTGIPRHLEKKVSPIFIKSEDYGTRCSTILLIDKNGEVSFTEKRFKAGTKQTKESNRYRFSIEEQVPTD